MLLMTKQLPLFLVATITEHEAANKPINSFPSVIETQPLLAPILRSLSERYSS